MLFLMVHAILDLKTTTTVQSKIIGGVREGLYERDMFAKIEE